MSVGFSDLMAQLEKHEAAPTLFEIGHQLEDSLYWGVVGDEWERSESHYRQMILWEHLLRGETMHGTKDLELRHEMCGDVDDQEWLKARIEDGLNVTVYRGGQMGWSWTTDKEKGEWFAGRSAQNGEATLHTAEMDPNLFIAYRSGRGESEVIFDPGELKSVETLTWQTENTPVSQLAQLVQDRGSDVLFGSPYEAAKGRAAAFIHSGGDMYDRAIDHLSQLAIYAASIGAATVSMRLNEQLRGYRDGKDYLSS